MRPFRRLGRVLKAAGQAVAMRFVGATRTGWGWAIRGSRFDFAGAVGDGTGNSAVMAVLNFLMRTFPEAPVQVGTRGTDGKVEWTAVHDMVELLERPNPYYSGPLLWMATLLDYVPGGNAYWLKVRSGTGRPVELYWAPAFMMEPKWPQDGSQFISHYEYKPNGVAIPYDPADVVHFRWGIDPSNTRKGLSQLASVLREVYTDDEAANFGAALLRNFGIPGVVIAPEAKESYIEESDALAMKAKFQENFGGDNRGNLMVMTDPVKVSVMSFSPADMDLKMLRRLPEERVSAVLGVPAIVAGLGAGLDRSTFANMAEARQAAYESNIIPMQRLFAADLKSQLLPDFEDTRGKVVRFDNSDVRVLQDDQDALYRRADLGVRGGWLTVGEGKSLTGLATSPADDYYLRSITVSAVPLAEAGIAPPRATATTVEPPVLPPGKSRPQTKAAAETRETLIDRLAEPYGQELRGVFGRQSRAVMAAWQASKATRLNGHQPGGTALLTKVAEPAELLGAEWDDVFREISTRFTYATAGEAATLAEGVTGIEGLFDLALPRIQETADRLAMRITSVNDTTRDRIRSAIVAGSDAGESVEEIGTRIRGVMDDASQTRARMISRSEITDALNLSSVDCYEASGVVSGVRVTDGDQDAACATANGATWTLSEARAHPTSHPNCLVGDSLVIAPHVTAAFARWFEGDVVVIRTAANDLLTCTPNHPILTDRGWIAAGVLKEGDNVLRCIDTERVALAIDPDNQQVPTRIEQVAGAFLEACAVPARTVESTAEYFHGDGGGSEVYVIGSNGFRERERDAALREHGSERPFNVARVGLGALLPDSAAAQVFDGTRDAKHGSMSGGGIPLASVSADLVVPQALSLANRPADTGTSEPGAHRGGVDVEHGSDLLGCELLIDVERTQHVNTGMGVIASGLSHAVSALRELSKDGRMPDAVLGSESDVAFARLIAPVQISEVYRRQFAGHVYNLETRQGWYIADGIITHNCTRAFTPIVGSTV